jgi:hypothetical protein
MNFKGSRMLKIIDETVNDYLLFLVHVQQSAPAHLSATKKITVFDEAEAIAKEMHAIVQKTLAVKLNDYNYKDTIKYIDENLFKMDKRIKGEEAYYIKNINIDDDKLFYMKDIVETLSDKKYEINFSKDSIRRLYSYNELLRDVKSEKENNEITKNLKQSMDNFNKVFDTIKFKAFQDMIHGVNHKNEDNFTRQIISSFRII